MVQRSLFSETKPFDILYKRPIDNWWHIAEASLFVFFPPYTRTSLPYIYNIYRVLLIAVS